MAATVASGTGSPESLASLERLKQVETDTDGQLRMVRGKIDLTLSQLRSDSEAQIQSARAQAEEDAAALLVKAQKEADVEADRILAEAKASLAQRAKAGLPDLTPVWPDILNVLFGEFS
jgi:F0F1-type ATP synthase membrane subunit b/b'